MRVLVKTMAFVGGSRVRPGEVIDWPAGRPLAKNMEEVKEAGTAPAVAPNSFKKKVF